MATMEPPVGVRDELLDRRAKLERAIPTVADPEPLQRLLGEVDETLERIADGSFGLCSVCHDPIEADRLAADPLLRNCIDHLTAAEQRALEHDLDLSGRLQTALLPARQLQHGEWEIAHHYQPLGAVSGDYCDVVVSPQGVMDVLVGDVAGKGLAASLLMTYLHATFRSLGSINLDLADMVGRANHLLCESTGGHSGYATLVCARAHPGGAVEVLNAGHCPPLHVGSGKTTTIPAGGLPLGLFCTCPYTTTRIDLAPGDTLVIYTDGVSEAANPQGEEYGETRLVRAMEQRRTASPIELIQGSLDDLTTFRNGSARADDVTLLALRRSRP